MARRSTCLIGLHVLQARSPYPDSAITLERLRTLVPKRGPHHTLLSIDDVLQFKADLHAAIKGDDV